MFVLHWDQMKCPVYKRCLIFTFRGSTVLELRANGYNKIDHIPKFFTIQTSLSLNDSAAKFGSTAKLRHTRLALLQ